MTPAPVYRLEDYGNMIADAVRTEAYVAALERAVRPGCVVVDIGTGTGFLAIMAARLGARRVFAIEPDDVIEVAREVAAANGAGAIEFLQRESMACELPERADVVVADLHGSLPYFGTHLVAMADARRRFLAPGGVLIPRRERLWMCCVEFPDLHRRVTVPWKDNRYGIDMTAVGRLEANRRCRTQVRPEQCVSAPQPWGEIDFASIEDPDADAAVRMQALRDATAHGLCAWFDMTLAEGIELSNSPQAPPSIYGNTFFPWPEAVALAAGDVVTVRISAKLVQTQYVCSWETRIERAAAPALHFAQSDFLAAPLAASRLHRQSADFVPQPNEEASIDGAILELIAQRRALGDIAREIARRHPQRFSGWEEALGRVGELSLRYSR